MIIDAHVHIYGPGTNQHLRAIAAIANAQKTLRAGFTTVLDMDSRGGFGTVELRNAINSGLVRGPEMQVAGQSLNPRGARATANTDIRTCREAVLGGAEGPARNGPCPLNASSPRY